MCLPRLLVIQSTKVHLNTRCKQGVLRNYIGLRQSETKYSANLHFLHLEDGILGCECVKVSKASKVEAL